MQHLGTQQVMSVVIPTGRRRGPRWVRNTSVDKPGPQDLRPCSKVLGPQIRKAKG